MASATTSGPIPSPGKTAISNSLFILKFKLHLNQFIFKYRKQYIILLLAKIRTLKQVIKKSADDKR